jgi:deoxyadenosine/deoxycytidine kinase
MIFNNPLTWYESMAAVSLISMLMTVLYNLYRGISVIDPLLKIDNLYGFSFQILAFTSRLTYVSEKTKNLTNLSYGIMERSMRSDKEVFFENLKSTEFEKHIYDQFYGLCCADFNKLERIMIRMDVPVEDCFNRIKSRGVESEQSIPIIYLHCINALHEKMYTKFEEAGGTVIHLKWQTFTSPLEFQSAIDGLIDKLGQLKLSNLK